MLISGPFCAAVVLASCASPRIRSRGLFVFLPQKPGRPFPSGSWANAVTGKSKRGERGAQASRCAVLLDLLLSDVVHSRGPTPSEVRIGTLRVVLDTARRRFRGRLMVCLVGRPGEVACCRPGPFSSLVVGNTSVPSSATSGLSHSRGPIPSVVREASIWLGSQLRPTTLLTARSRQ